MADHLNVGSLRGLLVGPSRGSRGFTYLLPSVFLLLGCPNCSGCLLLRVPEGWPLNPAPSKGSTPPSGNTHSCCYCMVEGGLHLDSQPQVFTSSRNTRSSAGLAGQNFQKETITLNIVPSSNAFSLPEMRMEIQVKCLLPHNKGKLEGVLLSMSLCKASSLSHPILLFLKVAMREKQRGHFC